jgi:hypothetical protein
MLGILWAKFDMADIIGKSGATEICMLMAEAPLDILIAVSARKALINSIGYLRLVDSYIASLPTYTVEMHCHAFT